MLAIACLGCPLQGTLLISSFAALNSKTSPVRQSASEMGACWVLVQSAWLGDIFGIHCMCALMLMTLSKGEGIR